MATSVQKFEGSEPISVLRFLARFKVTANNNGISEGGARLVLRNLLEGKAAAAYDASLWVDAIGEDAMGIQIWPEWVR